jgi:hypothetical protein
MKKGTVGILLLAMLGVVFLGGCGTNLPPWKKLRGRGGVTSQEHSLPGDSYSLEIADIQFTGSWTGVIEVDEDLPDVLALSTEENIAATITVTVDEDRGKIRLKGDKGYRYSTENLKIQVGVPLYRLQIDGGYSLDLKLPSATDFALHVNGAVSGSLAFEQLDSLEMVVNGAGSLTLTGSGQKANVHINGAANIDATDFDTVDSAIAINGAGHCQVRVTGNLEAEVNGVGSITYYGSPTTVNKKVAGLGSIKKGE